MHYGTIATGTIQEYHLKTTGKSSGGRLLRCKFAFYGNLMRCRIDDSPLGACEKHRTTELYSNKRGMLPEEPLAMWRIRTKWKSGRKDLSDEKIREIARKHFAEDFPNRERRGCPPITEIKQLADKPVEGKDWVLDHVRHCSPCYRDLADFLRAGRKKLGAKSNGSD
jgi:hypothetical protein